MNAVNTTVCLRCGKQRIVLSVNEETIGNSVVSTTETICPDPDCQKKVDGILAVEQQKRHQSFVQKQARMTSKKPAKAAV